MRGRRKWRMRGMPITWRSLSHPPLQCNHLTRLPCYIHMLHYCLYASLLLIFFVVFPVSLHVCELVHQAKVYSKFVNRFTIALSYFNHLRYVGYDPMHTLAGVAKDIIGLVMLGKRYVFLSWTCKSECMKLLLTMHKLCRFDKAKLQAYEKKFNCRTWLKNAQDKSTPWPATKEDLTRMRAAVAAIMKAAPATMLCTRFGYVLDYKSKMHEYIVFGGTFGNA
jgi:hypothetical protein